jgi:radical SAM protein with 4Fe4S-binding SPASM domain
VVVRRGQRAAVAPVGASELGSAMKATVIVPTYNRSERLRCLLRCLAAQTGSVLARVVVCDDGSSDDTRDVVRSFESRLPVLYCFQEDRGFRAGQARNMGLSRAVGDVVIFLDDDVLVATDFVEQHVRAHRSAAPDRIAIGFRHRGYDFPGTIPTIDDILHSEPDDRVAVLGNDGAGVTRHSTPWWFVYSCNVSVALSSALPRFDEAFVGWGIEDIEWGYRLTKTGYQVVCASAARALHVEDSKPRDPFRCETRDIDPTYDSYVRNAVYFLDRHPRDPLLAEVIRRDLQWYVRDSARGAWVKNGYANDVNSVIAHCRREREGHAGDGASPRPQNGAARHGSGEAASPLAGAATAPATKPTVQLTPGQPSGTLTHLLDQLAVELTVYCNLRCKMCSVWEIRQHGVPLDLAKRLLEDAYELGARTFVPCGAESFVRKDFLDVVEHAHSLGYTAQEIVTNGTLITAAHLDRLAQCPSVQLHISIDGPRAVHDELRGAGMYDASVATAERALARGIRVGLSAVILRETLAHLSHVIDLATDLGVAEVSYQPFQMEISGPHKDVGRFSLAGMPRAELIGKLDALEEYARERGVRIFTEALFPVIPDYAIEGRRPIPVGGCYLPSKFILVDYRGDVYPCFFMRQDQDRMGNVHRDRLPDLWHSVHHQQLQLLALTERCPGCLAACSDVDTFNRAVHLAPEEAR